MPRVNKKQRELIEPLRFERPDNGWRPTELPQLQSGEPISFDFEYKPDNNPTLCEPFAYSFYRPLAKQKFYVPWAHEGGGNLPKEVAMRWLKDNVKDRDVYGLNFKAEAHSMYNLDIDPNGQNIRPHDVAFPPTLLDEQRVQGFSLEALAVEWLPEDERKVHPVNIEPQKFYLAHAGEMAERGMSDSYLAWRIHEMTRPLIQEQSLERVNQVEDNCILPTVHMERAGVRIDVGKAEHWIKEINRYIELAGTRIHSNTGVWMDNDGEKCLSALFAFKGLDKPIVYNEKEKIEEASWSIEGLKSIPDLDIQAAYTIRQLRSLKSKYFEKWLKAIDGNNILRYNLHQLRSTKSEFDDDPMGTCTGRYASGGDDWKINIQQFMKCEKQIEVMGPEFIVRELVIPAEGKLCFADDASQIEFRLFSHYAALIGYPATAYAYAKNPHEDFHMLVTILMNPGITDKAKLKALRKHMKHNNFGVLYGMGRPKLARRLGLPCTCTCDWMEEYYDDQWGKMRRVRYFRDNESHELNCAARKANDIMDEYDERFPEARLLLKMASKQAETRGYVLDLIDRRGRFDGHSLHKALNKIIQGGAASYFKIKLAELFAARKTLAIDLRAPVHDEFMGDIDPDPKFRVMKQELLDTNSLPLRVPLLWDSGCGANWREANGQ